MANPEGADLEPFLEIPEHFDYDQAEYEAYEEPEDENDQMNSGNYTDQQKANYLMFHPGLAA